MTIIEEITQIAEAIVVLGEAMLVSAKRAELLSDCYEYLYLYDVDQKIYWPIARFSLIRFPVSNNIEIRCRSPPYIHLYLLTIKNKTNGRFLYQLCP